MAAQKDFRQDVQQLQRQEGNKMCFDCAAVNPQMVTTECSGQHRSLGVHISFVRSISMDSWREEQYKKMKFGGNAKAHDFFRQYGIDQLPLKQKYYTKAAELYKEKLSAEVEGRVVNLPAPSPELARPNLPGAPVPLTGTGVSSASSGGNGMNNSMPANAQKARNEEYFARMGNENATRSEDLPPNQGGRYQGFGNSEYAPQSSHGQNDILGGAFSTFSKGISFFTAKTVEVAKMAAVQAEHLTREVNEHVVKPTAQKLQDPNLRQNISTTFASLGKTVVETGDKGFNYISKTIAGAQGYAHADDMVTPYDANDELLSPPAEDQAFATQVTSTSLGTPSNFQAAAPSQSLSMNTQPIQPLAAPTNFQPSATTAPAAQSTGNKAWSPIKDDEWGDF